MADVQAQTEKLTTDFREILNVYEVGSDGEYEVKSLVCDPAYDGVFCMAEVALTEFVSWEDAASGGGGEENCQERYQYRGGNCFVQTGSTCKSDKSTQFPVEVCFEDI